MNRTVQLWPGTPPAWDPTIAQNIPSMTLFPCANAKGAVLVLPGGGYQYKADHEGAPVAQRLNDAGIFAAVLDYRVAPYRAPVPQWDALRALQLLRLMSGDYGYDANHVAILGFSAGGHLAASVAYLDIPLPEMPADDPASACAARPDAAVLCYPVITMGAFTHQGSRNNLLGPDSTDAQREAWSVERQVRDGATPAFLWHTSDDGSVPVQNSLMLADALAAHQTPFALHIWPHGHHGLGLATETTDVRQWMPLAAEWLHSLDY